MYEEVALLIVDENWVRGASKDSLDEFLPADFYSSAVFNKVLLVSLLLLARFEMLLELFRVLLKALADGLLTYAVTNPLTEIDD